MTNVAYDAGALTGWTETDTAVKMLPHKARVWHLETAYLMAFRKGT